MKRQTSQFTLVMCVTLAILIMMVYSKVTTLPSEHYDWTLWGTMGGLLMYFNIYITTAHTPFYWLAKLFVRLEAIQHQFVSAFAAGQQHFSDNLEDTETKVKRDMTGFQEVNEAPSSKPSGLPWLDRLDEVNKGLDARLAVLKQEHNEAKANDDETLESSRLEDAGYHLGPLPESFKKDDAANAASISGRCYACDGALPLEGGSEFQHDPDCPYFTAKQIISRVNDAAEAAAQTESALKETADDADLTQAQKLRKWEEQRKAIAAWNDSNDMMRDFKSNLAFTENIPPPPPPPTPEELKENELVDRLKFTPGPIDDALAKEIQKELDDLHAKHPEHGFLAATLPADTTLPIKRPYWNGPIMPGFKFKKGRTAYEVTRYDWSTRTVFFNTVFSNSSSSLPEDQFRSEFLPA